MSAKLGDRCGTPARRQNVSAPTIPIAQATEENPVTRRLHVAFFAPTHGEVDEFWRVGTDAGYRDDGAPGPRPQYSRTYYGSFLLDPDGNSAEAVYHDAQRRCGSI